MSLHQSKQSGDVIGGRWEIVEGPVAIQYPEGYRCPHCDKRCTMYGHKDCREAARGAA